LASGAGAMAISALFFLDVKGRVIIHRDYRGDISTKYAEKFMSKINEYEESGKLTPVLHDDGINYVYLQHANLYVLAVTRTNVNAAAVVLFLHRLVGVFKHYFQELEEESIRDNFVIVYELLDEVRSALRPALSYCRRKARAVMQVAHCAGGWQLGTQAPGASSGQV
jgi:AP-1 complex subunit mu